MKLLSGQQIRNWDQYTIQHDLISSIDLMERAALSFVRWFAEKYPDTGKPVVVFCGNGNNGGDGLAIARLLRQKFYEVHVFILRIASKDSNDFAANLNQLVKLGDIQPVFIEHEVPVFQSQNIIIDALMGTGVNKPVAGQLQDVIRQINRLANCKISVDMPSGLPTEGLAFGEAIRANLVFTFQVPKLSFFLKENEIYCPSWVVGDIGLNKTYLEEVKTSIYLMDREVIHSFYRPRTRFQHKGDFGHALIIAGSDGKIGAAVLSAKACLRSGAGLVSVMVPQSGREVIHASIPEAMVIHSGRTHFTPENRTDFTVFTVGCGPGIGTDPDTISAVRLLISQSKKAMVIDADGLNIVSKEADLLKQLPPDTILTPHPKEFERLFGASPDSAAMFALQLTKSVEYGLIIVLKGAYTRITTPGGKVYINSTGNSGMATAGSGDVLTGIITGLLAQKYTPEAAAVIGVYLHGLAGDLCLEKESKESMLASDIILNLGRAFNSLKPEK